MIIAQISMLGISHAGDDRPIRKQQRETGLNLAGRAILANSKVYSKVCLMRSPGSNVTTALMSKLVLVGTVQVLLLVGTTDD